MFYKLSSFVNKNIHKKTTIKFRHADDVCTKICKLGIKNSRHFNRLYMGLPYHALTSTGSKMSHVLTNKNDWNNDIFNIILSICNTFFTMKHKLMNHFPCNILAWPIQVRCIISERQWLLLVKILSHLTQIRKFYPATISLLTHDLSKINHLSDICCISVGKDQLLKL